MKEIQIDRPDENRIQKAIEALVKKHGSLRAAARAVGIDAAYLHRMRRAQCGCPPEGTLAKLGLEVRVNYVRKGNGS